jgi:hypothetical protein
MNKTRDELVRIRTIMDFNMTKAKQLLTNLIIKLDQDDHQRIVEKLNKPLNIDINNNDENHL